MEMPFDILWKNCVEARNIYNDENFRPQRSVGVVDQLGKAVSKIVNQPFLALVGGGDHQVKSCFCISILWKNHEEERLSEYMYIKVV